MALVLSEYTFTYKLSPKVQVVDIKAPEGIEFHTTAFTDIVKHLDSFSIHLEEDNDLKARTIADAVAKGLTDKIILRCQQFTESRLDQSTKKAEGNNEVEIQLLESISMHTDVVVSSTLDLSDLSIESLQIDKIETDFEQRLNSLKQGMKAIDEDRFEEAIKQLYLVMEGRLPKDSHKFVCLRDAISHFELDEEKITKLNGKYEWKIDIVDRKFNRASENNLHILQAASEELKGIASKYLREDYHPVPRSDSQPS